MGLLEETAESLKRMQTFDTALLIQEARLGKDKAFTGAVVPAARLIELYVRLTERALQDFPEQTLNQVKQRANSDYQLLDQVLTFDTNRTTAERDGIVNSIAEAYTAAFGVLHPLVAYSLHRSADFQRLDSDARAMMQDISDRTVDLTKELKGAKDEAKEITYDVASRGKLTPAQLRE